jgi:Zn-finger nucleic acid-binding protein
MKCPRTGIPLTEINIQGIQVDISKACGGVWFDNFELNQFDEAHEDAGEELSKLLNKYCKDGIDVDKKILCPCCETVTLQRHYFSIKKTVEIDECPKCGGVWLDPGELEKIRNEYATEKERKEKGIQFVDEIYENSELKRKLDRRKSANIPKSSLLESIFKFLRPKALREDKDEFDL